LFGPPKEVRLSCLKKSNL